MNQFPLLVLAVSLTASLASSQEIRPLDWSKIEGGASDDELVNLCATVLEHTQKDMGRDWLDKVADTPVGYYWAWRGTILHLTQSVASMDPHNLWNRCRI